MGSRMNRATAPVRWYVTSSHKVGAFGDEKPYGLKHARQPGTPVTACGVLALTWPIFWDRPFAATSERTCRACGQLLHEQDTLRPRAVSAG